MPWRAAQPGATSPSSTSNADTNGLLSPMTAAWATSGMDLSSALEVGRGDVLAAGGDDQLLLAVDDAQVAVVVELADVAGVQPAVVVDRPAVFSGSFRYPWNTWPPGSTPRRRGNTARSEPGMARPTVPGLTLNR